MCLFPGGGFNMQPIVPPTAAAQNLKKPVFVVMLVHLALSLCLFFVDVSTGLQNLIMVLILWCAIAQFHYCQIIIYMMMSMFNWVNVVASLGLLIQKGMLFSVLASGGMNTFMILLVMSLAVFYPVAGFFCFKAYREFKGMAHDHGMLQGGGMSSLMGARRSEGPQYQQMGGNEMRANPPSYAMRPVSGDNEAPPANPSGFRPFQGAGTRLGGGAIN